MATTVTAPVSNSIALAQRFLPMLDELYKVNSRSAVLDTISERVSFVGASAVNIYNVDPVGMANYSRNAGYVPGDVDGTWQTYTLNTDRGRSYLVDVLDNEESMGMAFGGLLSEVERLQVIPEVDAFRFAQYAAGASSTTTASAAITSGSAAIAAIDAATVAMDNAEVPYEGRILFVSPSMYGYIKAGVTRMVMNRDDNINYNIDMYNDMRVITVPQSRFVTAIDLAAPTTASATGGYTKASTAVDINFMIIHPTAVLQVMKHYAPKIFSPAVVQDADAWKLTLRFAHGAWVLNHKKTGIYLHKSTT